MRCCPGTSSSTRSTSATSSRNAVRRSASCRRRPATPPPATPAARAEVAMIVGLGVDVCDVARIRRALEGRAGARFQARVFTAAEQAYCEARRRGRFASYAARFAAKEAAMKALGTGWAQGVGWRARGARPRAWSFTAARRRLRAGAAWRAGSSPSRTRTRARSPRWWSRTASTQRARRRRRRAAAREKDQDGHRPEAGHEPEEGPQVLRVPVVVREQPAEDRVADVERERRAEERRGREIGRHEGEPREIGDGGRERHPIDRASGPSL